MLGYQGAVTLSKKEQMRYSVVEKYRAGRFSREEAAKKLNLSPRQVSRLARKVRESGFKGVVHGNTGSQPWNKISQETIDTYVRLYEEKYSKFNYFHALEMMALHEEIAELSYTCFRKACRKKGIGKVKKRRASKARIARERYSEEGFMWQLDGSPDKWDGVDTSTLIALIDDATSKVPGAALFPSETTWACMNVVREAIEKYGKPEFILTDKAGWSEGSGRKRMHFSQFERACLELGITVIATPTAESKGRIERLNRTFQDRLIPELDLYGIRGLQDCNRFMDQVFIPDWNKKFTVEALSPVSRYSTVEAHIDLREVFCVKKMRIVNRDHTLSYSGNRYKINPETGKKYKGKEVNVHEYEDGSISIYYGGKKLESAKIIPPKRVWKNCA